jgi:hypothetical protein
MLRARPRQPSKYRGLACPVTEMWRRIRCWRDHIFAFPRTSSRVLRLVQRVGVKNSDHPCDLRLRPDLAAD